MILWRLLLGFMLTALCLLLIAVCVDRVSKGDEPVALPPEILACMTDIECEDAARLLCEQGDFEWCLKEA